MTNLEKRQAERASFLYQYREYQRVCELSAPDGSAVYIFTRPELAPKCCLLAFSGTAGKASAHYSYRTIEQDSYRTIEQDSYRTIEQAEKYAADFLTGRNAHQERITQHRAERSGFRTALKVGSVLVNSWGYDQTNIDYFQVTAVSETGRTVTIRPIAARTVEDGPVAMSGSCWPLADHFTGPEMVKHVRPGDSVKIHEWGSYAHLWEPKPDRWSAYA